MSAAEFLAFYPQFTSVIPEAVLSAYVDSANLRFTDFGTDAPAARRLYTAHKLTLYSASCLPEGAESPTMAQLTSAGKGSMQEIASKRVGEVSVSYSTNTSLASANHTGLNDLKQTVYGLQLLSLLRVYGFARYIP